jgi:hypothetical protein
MWQARPRRRAAIPPHPLVSLRHGRVQHYCATEWRMFCHTAVCPYVMRLYATQLCVCSCMSSEGLRAERATLAQAGAFAPYRGLGLWEAVVLDQHCPGRARASKRPLCSPQSIGFCTALLCGRAGRLTAQYGGFRPGQSASAPGTARRAAPDCRPAAQPHHF